MAETVELDNVSGTTDILYDLCKGTETLWVLISITFDLRSGEHQLICNILQKG